MEKEVKAVIPVVEEEISIHREEVETGRVRVRTVSEEHTEVVSEDLRRSEAQVDRVFINQEVSELPPIREEGDTIIVPLVEERLVKRLFLVEEVRLSRKVFTEHLEQPVKLRTQRVVVERQASGGDAIHKE